MNIISTGFSGTGSSAVIHLLSEYDGFTQGRISHNYEHVLFYIPNGLFDLEDRLLMNNTIHMSDGAFEEFRKAMKRLNDHNFGWFGGYQKKFGNQFMDSVDELINNLTQYTLRGYWSNDFEYTKIMHPKALLRDLVKKIIGKPTLDFGKLIQNRGDGQIRVSFVSKQEYADAVKIFVRKYLNMFNNGEKNLLLDQLLLPQNLKRLSTYFDDDVRVIVVNRDPRDMYILAKYVWPRMSGSASYPNTVDEFISFYANLRESANIPEDPRILIINFEDLIYFYDITVDRIEKFIGIDSSKHINKGRKLIVEQSIKNTQNFRIEESWKYEVEKIEQELKPYIYKFPYEFTPNINDTSDPT